MTQASRPQALRAHLAVATIFLASGLMGGAWAARVPNVKSMLGLSEASFGLLLLLMALGGILAFPFAGRAIDGVGAARSAKIAAIAFIVFFAILPFGTTVALMAPMLLAFGISLGATDVAMNAWAAEIEKHLDRPILSGLHGLYSLGAGIGAGLGALTIWAHWSLETHFWVSSIALVICVAWAWTIPWEVPRKPEPEFTPTGDPILSRKPPLIALPRGSLLLVAAMTCCSAISEGAATDWAAIYQIQELGFTASRAAIGFTVFSAAMVLMRFAGDRLITGYGSLTVARASAVSAMMGALLIVSGINETVVWGGCALLGFGNAVIFPIAFSRAANDPVMSPGAAMAAVSTLAYGAFLVGPPVIGFIGQHLSLRAAFGLIACLGLTIFILAQVLLRQDPTRER